MVRAFSGQLGKLDEAAFGAGRIEESDPAAGMADARRLVEQRDSFLLQLGCSQASQSRANLPSNFPRRSGLVSLGWDPSVYLVCFGKR